MNLNIVFAGTPAFAKEVLAALLQSHFSPKAVFTQPDRPQGRGQKVTPSPVKTLALEHNLPVFQPVHLKAPEEQQLLRDLKPDLLIVVAYGLILPQAVLSIPKYGCINVHASLLPRWRGAAPIQHAILAGDKETGITIMQMDKGLDTGDMLYVKSCPIHTNDTSQTLYDRLSSLGANALIQALKQLEAGTLTATPQDNAEACYATKIQKQDAKILWHTENAEQIERKIRAFHPWPIAFFEVAGENVRVFEATVLNEITVDVAKTPAGTILQASAEGIDVATRIGVLRLQQLQLPGKKPLAVKEILNAHANVFTPGNILT